MLFLKGCFDEVNALCKLFLADEGDDVSYAQAA